MKQLLIALFILTTFNSYCQKDANGNPVFNSVTIGEEMINGIKLSSNYYTLKNNIENKTSSVFISSEPTLKEITKAAVGLPSDFFAVIKDGSIIKLIMITAHPKRKILVVDPSSGKSKEYKFPLKGELTQNRAEEMVKEKYDSNAVIKDGQLFFNNEKLDIISNEAIRAVIIELISKEGFADLKPSDIKVLSKEELKNMILEQTKEGGKLDFFTPIKGKEYESVMVRPNVMSTQIGMALYNWGRASFDLGVNKLEDALAIFAEFKGRVLNEREINYIKLGFEKGLEK